MTETKGLFETKCISDDFREEIKRLKIEHPNMPHKQAFSAAAKNVSLHLIKCGNCKISDSLSYNMLNCVVGALPTKWI